MIELSEVSLVFGCDLLTLEESRSCFQLFSLSALNHTVMEVVLVRSSVCWLQL